MAVSEALCDTGIEPLAASLILPSPAMSFLSRLESKFGRFAVPNLTLALIVGQAFLYVAGQLNPGGGAVDVLDKIRFDPARVLSGEVWRLVTFLFDPPMSNPIFAFFFWYLFYLMGTTLEGQWGTFRYNVFLAIGYLASVVMAFVVYFASGGQNIPVDNFFLYGTVFLAFARLYPDFVLYILFILPVKIRWLALIQWIGYAVGLLGGDWMTRGMIVASVLNFLLFFGREIWRDIRQGRRRMQFQTRTRRAPQRMVHKCALCGLTSDDAPQAQFRYCSRCEGELCYCPEHLQNHEHVVRREAEVVRERAG
jgi:hypothetical protein